MAIYRPVALKVGAIPPMTRTMRSREIASDPLLAPADHLPADGPYRTLVELAPDSLVIVDATGAIIVVNEAAEKLTGYPRDELLGQPVEMLVPDQVAADHSGHRAGYHATPQRRPMGDGKPLRLRCKDGTEVPVDISLSPADLGTGPVVVAAVRDVTDRVRSEAALRASEARLAAAERLAVLGSWSWDQASGRLVWSETMFRIFGDLLEPGSAPDPDFDRNVHPDDRSRLAAARDRTMTTAEPFDEEYRIVLPSGDVRWIHGRGEVAAWGDGRAVRLTGFCQDITATKEAEQRSSHAQEELARHQRVLERIVRGEPVEKTLESLCLDIEAEHPSIRCSVLLVDANERVLRHAAAPSLPLEFQREIDGLPIAAKGLGPCSAAVARHDDVLVTDIAADPLTSAFVDLAAACELRSAWAHLLTSASGEVLGVITAYWAEPHVPDDDEVRAVTIAGSLAALGIERSRTERALKLAAHVDPLTGLPNRARFLERVNGHLAEPGARIAVMFLDVDRFKWINDSLGHPAGDVILVEVAARISRLLRGRDVVARFGGDEFTVLVTGATPAAVSAIAARVEDAFAEPFVLDGGEFFLTVSIGIAFNDHPVDASGLVRDADAAMYAAKEGGRARHVMFDEGLRNRAVTRVTLESELRRALERDELVAHYQPILDLATGRWVGVEALARWEHPTRGLIAPDQFIPLAEETGLIVPIGAQMLDGIMAQAAKWVAGGHALRVAVNISVVQLSDPLIASEIDAALRRHGLPADLLVLEVTESTVMQQLDTARVSLEQISALGVEIVIDDFGTGYSSIARLGELPVVGVKIDRSFTATLGLDTSSEKVLCAITDLAHALDLTVVAEGIETAIALSKVREVGCDYGQGYHLGRPVPAPRIDELLRTGPMRVPRSLQDRAAELDRAIASHPATSAS